MKKYLLLIIMVLLGSIFAYAQRYVVNGKDGKIRVVEYHLVDGEWTNVKYAPDIYIENGYEFEAVPPVSKDKIVMEYNGKYYHVVFPEKELKLVDDMGAGEGLGFRNAMRNSFIGDWYLGSSPAKLALLLTIIALVVFIISLFKDDVIPVLRYIFVGSVSCVAGRILVGESRRCGVSGGLRHPHSILHCSGTANLCHQDIQCHGQVRRRSQRGGLYSNGRRLRAVHNICRAGGDQLPLRALHHAWLYVDAVSKVLQPRLLGEGVRIRRPWHEGNRQKCLE